MKMEVLPLYCGGRYLFGFHSNPNFVPSDGWYNHLTKPPYTVFSREVELPGQPAPVPDKYRSYMPWDFEVFCQVLRKWAEMQGLNIGTILAATNPTQDRAVKYLAEVGFKKGPLTRKNEWANKCQTWTGDFHKDIWPFLKTIKLPEEKSNAKFGAKS